MEDSSKRAHGTSVRSQIEAKKRPVRTSVYDRETLKPKHTSSGSVSPSSTQSSSYGMVLPQPVDLATLYLQQLSSDPNARHERSSSAGLVNVSVAPASLQQGFTPSQLFFRHECEVPTYTDGLQQFEQPNSNVHLVRTLRCNSDGDACQSSLSATDGHKQVDAGVPTTEPALLCFEQETNQDQVSIPKSKFASDGETQLDQVPSQANSTPAHLTMSLTMPDVVASAIQRVSSGNTTQLEPSVACAIRPDERRSTDATDEAGKVISNSGSFAAKGFKPTYNASLGLVRAHSSEYKPATMIARADAIELQHGPIRVLESTDQRALVVGERQTRTEEYAPRAAKLKKFGSGEQLAAPTHTKRHVPMTKRSDSACESIKPSDSAKRHDEAHVTFAMRTPTSIGTSNWSSATGSSLNSSQSTVDSLESASFGTRSHRLSPFLSARSAPTASTDAVQQLTAEINESAMMNYDEEIAEHLVNATSNSRLVAMHRNGIDTSSTRFGAAAQHVNGCTHSVHDNILASPATAGRRSAYFPSTVCERCTNPVSNVLEFGDERHFIPLRNPSRDDV